MPRPEIAKFSGDPLQFKNFLNNFETHVESQVRDQITLFCLLVQHCTNPTKNKIKRFSEKGELCYQSAKQRLIKEYGFPWVVWDVCKQKLKSFPTIKHRNAKELKRFADLLDRTFVILQSINYLNSLNSLHTHTQFVQKLPNALKERWVKKSVQIENATNSTARFSDFNSFVQAESEEANSVFGLRLFGTKNLQSKVKTSAFNVNVSAKGNNSKPNNCFRCLLLL